MGGRLEETEEKGRGTGRGMVVCSIRRSFDAFTRSMRPVREKSGPKIENPKYFSFKKVKQHKFFYFTYHVRNYIKIRLLCPTSPEVKKRLSLWG